jgi:hypothetical protein
MARCQGRRFPVVWPSAMSLTLVPVPQLPIRRAPHWRHHSNQSTRTRPRRQLRSLGRTLQHIRLRSQGNTEEGRPVECHHCRLLHRRLARGSRWIQVDAQWRNIMRHPVGRHRRCLYWLQPHDGRQHEARCSPTTAGCWRPGERRWKWHGRCSVKTDSSA